MLKAEIHQEVRGRFSIFYIAYGKNPLGPRGGNCGNIVDGEIVSPVVAGWEAPQWMVNAASELERLQAPEGTKVEHYRGSRKYSLIIPKAEKSA